MIESVESTQPISEPLVHFGSGPAAEEKECAGVFTALELTHPSSALIARVAHTLQEEQGKEQTHDAAVIKAATNTEAQMTAGDLPTIHNSIPDRCASDNFNSAAVTDAPLHTSQAGAAMVPGKCDVTDAIAQEISGQLNSAAVTGGSSTHETPDACDISSDLGPLTSDLQLLEGGVGAPPDEWRINEANRRLQIIQTFDELLLQGKTKAEAAIVIGESYTSCWRYRTAFQKDGYNGLLPSTDKCGRKSWLEKLGLTAEELKAAMEAVQGINLDTNSITGSLRAYASSPECPEALSRVILDPNRCSKHAIPPSIRDAARITKPQTDAHRGPRTLSLKGFYTPRKLDVIAGDVFTADDTTPIWAWWVPWRECEEYPFGVKLLQGQFIPIMDIASQDTPCGVLIAREKSSYRAADIWHLFGHVFDTIGLPRLGFQLERGSWEANIIRGQEVAYEADEATLSRRIGGLRQLPTNPHNRTPEDFIWPKTLQTFTSFLPKNKPIEAFFGRSQPLEGTLWGSLGQDQMRRPFEKAKKLFQQCSRPGAKMDPRNYFLSHTEIATRIHGILDQLRNEPMEGRVFKGIPRVNFESTLSELPLYQLPDELRWLYRRDWTVVTVTKGWAHIRVTHPITREQDHLFYSNPRFFAAMEGKEVAVYYDRENCQQPAQIIAASRFSVDGQWYEPGEFVCEAPNFDPPGMFLSTSRKGFEVAKEWRNAVMSTYITLAQHAPSRQLPPEIAARRAETRKSTAPSPQSRVVDNRPAPATGGTVFGSRITQPTDEQRQERSKALRGEAQLLRSLSGLE